MKSATVDLSQVPAVNWAKLAAYIDGEGCIRIHHNSRNRKTGHRYHGVQIVIAQRDVRLVEWLFKTFGGLYYKAKEVSGKTTMHYWRVNTLLAVELLEKCSPYMEVKADQAGIALEYRKYVTKGRSKLSTETRLMQEELRLKLDKLKHGHKANGQAIEGEA